MTTRRRPRPSFHLAEYDPILGPVLASRRGQPPRLVALAVTCRGLDAPTPIPPARIRLWLRSRGGQPLADITSSQRAFASTLIAARRRIDASASSSWRRREAVHVARRMVGFLLLGHDGLADGLAADWRPARVVRARHALAIIGLALIDSVLNEGRDTLLLSSGWLGERLGCSNGPAQQAMRDLDALGIIRVLRKRRGLPWRVDLGARKAHWGIPGADALLREHAETIDALVERRPTDDPLAEVIALAAHPAIGYALKPRPWLVAVADEAGVDARTLGLPASAHKTARTAWTRALDAQAGDETRTLADALDAHALRTGAEDLAHDAHARRRAAAAKRTREISEHRERVALVQALLKPALKAHPVPPPGHPDLSAWSVIMATEVATQSWDEAVVGLFVSALTTVILEAGHRRVKAIGASRKIAGLPDPDTNSEVTNETKRSPS